MTNFCVSILDPEKNIANIYTLGANLKYQHFFDCPQITL